MATFPTPIAVGQKRSKYGNKKTVVGGIKFDSQKEAKRWNELLMLQRAREIAGLMRQFRYPLFVNGICVCTYVADAVYTDLRTGHVVVEDVKGVKTPTYRLKKKMMKACLGIDVKEI